MKIEKIKVRRRCNNQMAVATFSLSCLLVMIIVSVEAIGVDMLMNQMEMETAAAAPQVSKSAAIIDAVKTLLSVLTSPVSWPFKLKALFQQGRNYFGYPNLDFRGKSESHGDEGTGEKVKEAVVKTLDKSKASIEGSAKSAARLAEDAVEKTVNKLKRKGEAQTEL